MWHLWLRRWNSQTMGNEYMSIEGPQESVDAAFLAIADRGWAPWRWKRP